MDLICKKRTTMLSRTKAKLDALYGNAPQHGSDAQLHLLHPTTRISVEQGQALAKLHRDLMPELSIEVGLAYGFSTLYMLDSMFEHHYGRHIAIDPYQQTEYHGIAVENIKELGFDNRFQYRLDLSSSALSDLHRDNERTQFVFIDGKHTFDACLTDFMLAEQMLDVGGLIALDDMWMPAIRKVVSFIQSNLSHFVEVETGIDNMYCARKTASDRREWDHFCDFGMMPPAHKRLSRAVYDWKRSIRGHG